MKNILFFLMGLALFSCASENSIDLSREGNELTLEDAKKLGLEPEDPPPPLVETLLPSPDEIIESEEDIPRENIPSSLDEKTLENPVLLTNALVRASVFSPDFSQFDRAIISYPYEKSYVYPIYTAEMRITDIFFTNEKIKSKIMLGDTANWVMERSVVNGVDHLFIKPKREGLRTNLVLTTDIRVYYMTLFSFKNTHMVGVTWINNGVVIQGSKPSSLDLEEEGGKVEIPTDSTLSSSQKNSTVDTNYGSFSFVSLSDLNFAYKIDAPKRNPPPWTPVQIADNGRQTIIIMKELLTGEMPTLFSGYGSKREVAQYRVDGRNYIVYGVFEYLELRSAGQRIRIIRE